MSDFNIYEMSSAVLKGIGTQLKHNIFEASHRLYTNGMFLSFCTLLLLIWLFTKIGNEFSKKDIWKLIVWIITFIFIQAILKNENTYDFVLKIFDLPKGIANAVMGLAMNSLDSDPIKIVQRVQNSLTTINIDTGSLLNPNIANGILYGILWLVSWALIVVMIVFIVFSSFIAVVIKSLMAVVLPFLIWNKTRGIFFAWLKLYISLSLYPPFAIFCSILGGSISKYAQETSLNGIANMGSFSSIVLTTIFYIMSIFMILKIPGWINQIIGSANDSDSMGAGLAIKTMAQGVGGMMKGVQSAGGGGNMGSKIGGIVGGAVGGGVGARIGAAIGGKSQEMASKAMSFVSNMRNPASRAK